MVQYGFSSLMSPPQSSAISLVAHCPGKAFSLYPTFEYLLLCNNHPKFQWTRQFLVTCSTSRGQGSWGDSHMGISFSCKQWWLDLKSCEGSTELMPSMASSVKCHHGQDDWERWGCISLTIFSLQGQLGLPHGIAISGYSSSSHDTQFPKSICPKKRRQCYEAPVA